MARARALVGGVLMLASAALMFYAFGFNVFTMFPIGMCGLAGVFAVLGALLPPVEAHH